ncbi:MAG: hypothetical protein Q7K13_09540 [Polynucleobacter sp.]|uniref:hypothetical protein n=1 Tax=Polynucleobacter sp. TaxID=2029855 RepID=UPI0027156CF9|nr:hypothetical protein [Polynucleobacter sp.]MDO8714698.1 hypothetical protein [Polynucleobacter sp.]
MIKNKKMILFLWISIISFVYAYLPFLLKANRFTWDSWIYFRLSRIFSQHLNFGTYASDLFSTDFPFGYPLLISISHLLFGINFISAPIMNSAIAILSAVIVFKIVSHALPNSKITLPIQILSSTSFLLSPFFLEEVYSGRSIPLALFMIVSSYYILIQYRSIHSAILAGLLIGASAIVRFDLLLGGLIILNTIFIFAVDKENNKFNYRRYFATNFGFLIGALPWILFSLCFTGSFFASKNSIVPISSIPISFTHFNDFHAMKIHTIFSNPLDWVAKVIFNLPAFSKSMLIALLCQPLFIVLVFYNIYNKTKHNLTPCIFILLTLTPHLASGFFDQRYFTFYFIICTLILIKTLNKDSIGHDKYHKAIPKLLGGLFLIFISIFSIYYLKYLRPNLDKNIVSDMLPSITRVASCHKNEQNMTYIFLPSSDVNDAVYAGITDFKVGFPVGYSSWPENEKVLFLKTVYPYRIINKVDSNFQCPQN